MASPNVHEFTDSNFDSEVLSSAQPVLVDFWAPWCGPCKMIGPVIDEIADETAGQFKVGKVNVDDNMGVAAKFGIQSIPALLFFQGGEKKAQVIGLTSKADMLARLKALA